MTVLSNAISDVVASSASELSELPTSSPMAEMKTKPTLKRSLATKMPIKSIKKQAKPGVWSPELVVTSEKSPLVLVDLKKVLAQPGAWTSLSNGQQTELRTMFQAIKPDFFDDQGLPKESFIRYDQDFAHALAMFKEDIKEGRNDDEWQRQGVTAYRESLLGRFDTAELRSESAMALQDAIVEIGGLMEKSNSIPAPEDATQMVGGVVGETEFHELVEEEEKDSNNGIAHGLNQSMEI